VGTHILRIKKILEFSRLKGKIRIPVSPEQENASHLCGAFLHQRETRMRVSVIRRLGLASLSAACRMFAFARTKKKLMQLAKAIQ